MALSVAATSHDASLESLASALAIYDVHAVQDIKVRHGLPVHLIIFFTDDDDSADSSATTQQKAAQFASELVACKV